jgi:hypothetical protein
MGRVVDLGSGIWKSAESRPMLVQETYKRSSRSGHSISIQAADDVIGPDKRKEP